jgi:hypothetical protein
LINGTFRKRWNFSESITGDFPFIIQGIGASFGLVDMVNSYGVDFTTKYLVCVLDNSITYFTSDYDSEVGCSLVLEIETKASIKNGFSVYPNPFSDRLILKTGRRLDNATLTIFNSQGQLARQVFNLTGSELVFYRDNLPGGLYSVRLTQDNKVIGSTQIIVE